jgi:hypothetical protein
MTLRGKIDQLYAHADEAEALEHLAADSASQSLRAQLQAISQWLAVRWVQEFGTLTAEANPERLPSILTELRDRLSAVHFDASQQLAYWANRARTLGITQAVAELKLPLPPALSGSIGRDTARAIDKVAATVADRLRRAERVTRAIRSGTHADVMPAVAAANGAVSDVERASRWITNNEVNNGSAQVAGALDAGVMWVAERSACLNCIAYSGVVADAGNSFPPDLTFGAKPLKLLTDTLNQPPLHPNCRCRLTVWLGSDGDYSLSDALKREARRSVLKGWSLPTESENSRLQAADRLLQQGAELPNSVEQQAQRAVRLGHFSSRTVPKP